MLFLAVSKHFKYLSENVCVLVLHMYCACTWPIIALNSKHEQTLNHEKSVKSLLSSRFDRTLGDWTQSRNIRNTVELNKIFFTHSPEAEFLFNQYRASTSVSDPELTNNK